VGDNRIIEGFDFGWAREDIHREELVFDGFDDELLSERAVKIIGRVTGSGVLEGGRSVEDLRSFLDREGHISPVIIRIFSVDEFLWDIDLDTSEEIDEFGESIKVDADVVVHFFSGDFTELIPEFAHCLLT